MTVIAYQPTWAPAAPTKAPLPPNLDGTRTSVAFKDTFEGAEVLGMSPGDPSKVVAALVKHAKATQTRTLDDPEKLRIFFQWFHTYMHHSYMEYVESQNPCR